MSELASPPSGAATPGETSEEAPLVPEQQRADGSAPDAPTVRTTPAHDVPTAPAVPPVPSGTIAGSLLASRYRLRTRVGTDPAACAEFWRAEDTILRRDVAVTVLRRPAPGAVLGDDLSDVDRAEQMVVRALRSGSFEHNGAARLLDVLTPGASTVPEDVLGAAVTEWVPGRSLGEVVADGLIKPLAAARAVAPLAAAAEAAHRHGLVLGCDHPQRVRITPDGRAQLCFALPRSDVTPADDVRGLGAVLYTLLTTHWPLSSADAARAGLAAAERTPAGALLPPSEHRPGVPVELDTLTSGTLGPDGAPGHVHTAAAVQRLLTEVVAEDDRMALFPPAHDGVPSAPGDVWQERSRTTTTSGDPQRRRKMTIALTALGAAVLMVLGYLGVQLGDMFVENGSPPIVVDGAPVQPAPGEEPQVAASPAGPTVAVAGVDVYDEVGDRDNADRVTRVIDGDPTTAWNTSNYFQQFPALKPGIGIMVSFASAVQLSEVVIESPSRGTVIEVRSAPSTEAALADTERITEVTLGAGRTPVSLDGSQPVEHVLIWITKLSGGGSEHTSELGEIEFRRAGV
ncbi:protein kinase family protein [Pseudonocardia sp. MH-G8]|uniref:protein kinase family protein n=1 Tax=Pseudonocardia sp. MH-G8 TaxID=1854588 RepID=UPI00117AFA78|nr:protein kinase family protein [Pseudonocardia sp. MH-G8]